MSLKGSGMGVTSFQPAPLAMAAHHPPDLHPPTTHPMGAA